MRQVRITGGPRAGVTEVRDASTGEFIPDYKMLLMFVEAGGTIVATGLKDGETFEVCGVDVGELDINAVLVSRGTFKEVIEG